jgi:hypothetical protein
MIANHIHDALRQVRELQERILLKQRFKGYSGRARALGGCVALGAGLLMHGRAERLSELSILWGWLLVVIFSAAINYGALFYWFLTDTEVKRDLRRLKPALEVVPVFFVAGVLTAVIAEAGHFHLLYGIWLCCYGLAQFCAREVLPRAIRWVGAVYLLVGALAFVLPEFTVQGTLVFGAILFLGEWAAGLVFHFDEPAHSGLRGFLGIPVRKTD